MHDWKLTTADTVEQALILLEKHRRDLRRESIPGELFLTGGSSIPGLLTKGDIDLHLRVTADQFAAAVSRLPRLYDIVLPDIWTSSFAVFEQDTRPPVGIAVTTLGSEHDRRFVRSWERMRAEEEARRRYNSLKRRPGDVEAAKSRFFDALVADDPSAGPA